jgi:cytochrome c-type biogenesis protein CcmH/NrfF
MKRCWVSDVRCQGRLHTFLFSVFCLLCVVFVLPPALAAPRTTVTDVARELICDCPDCGKQSLDQCATCAVGQKYRAEIARQLEQGRSKEQVITYFADTYGEHMLGNPRPRGFNRTALLMPLLVVAFGVVPLAFVLRSRRQGTTTEPAPATARQTADHAMPMQSTHEDPRVTAALREFDF